MDTMKITTENLSFSYQNKIILRDLSLQIPANKMIAITGPSGTGKSTLLSLFNRLWEEEGKGTQSGSVKINLENKWVDIYNGAMSLSQLRQKVGMVFQAPNPLPMSIYKNIGFPLELSSKRTKKEIRSRVEMALQEVHLWDEVKDRLTEDARKLSGGQQQRLCIARAMVLEPEVLLLDEPTSSLDDKSCEKIEELLTELKKRCTLLMVSHHQNQIRRIADHLYELEIGSINQVF